MNVDVHSYRVCRFEVGVAEADAEGVDLVGPSNSSRLFLSAIDPISTPSQSVGYSGDLGVFPDEGRRGRREFWCLQNEWALMWCG